MVSLESYYAQTLDFYQRLAVLYDFLYPDHLRFSDQLFDLLFPVLQETGTRLVLDASCGVGHDMSSLLNRGFQVDGLDISQSMLEEASRRLRQAGHRDFGLSLGDVRSLGSSVLESRYDLVIFRGNTLSNIHPRDLSGAVNQLLAVVRPGGLLLLDYRDGQQQIQEHRAFELRGWGIGEDRRTAFLSYYRLRHSTDLYQPYEVHATVHRVGLNFGYSVERLNIQSHYVVTTDLLSVVQQAPVRRMPLPAVSRRGLPYLETMLLQRVM
jgi:SAM-dependent methyltransferase